MSVARKPKQGFRQPNTATNVVVTVAFEHEGVTYSLHPNTALRVREAFPGVATAPTVYVGYATKGDFEQVHGPLWPQVLTLLTGVSVDRLRQLGPVLLWSPQTDEITEVR